MQTSQVVYPTYPQSTPAVTQLPDAQTVVTPEQAAQPAPAPTPAPEMQPAAYNPVAAATVTDPTPKRRSFTDTTADPSFAHAENYSWIKGRVECLHVRGEKVYRLRYASVDEEDKYGGAVNLTELGRAHDLKGGELVRIEGDVAEPDAHDTGSVRYRYRVRNIQPVNP
jgi:hypothetical protein